MSRFIFPWINQARQTRKSKGFVLRRKKHRALGWLRGRLRIHAAFLHALKLSFTA